MTKLRQKYIYYASIRGYLNVTATRSMIIIEAPLGVTFWGPSTSRGDADSYECRVDRMIDFKESGRPVERKPAGRDNNAYSFDSPR